MQRYSEWRPTSFDSRGLGLDDRQSWFVAPVIQTRDSDVLEESNFRICLELLGGSSDTVEIHRFGHWANGWFEIILAAPNHESTLTEIENTLTKYPILSEDDYSMAEFNRAELSWAHMRLRDRIYACVKYGVSRFAARRDNIPDSPTGELIGHLAE